MKVDLSSFSFHFNKYFILVRDALVLDLFPGNIGCEVEIHHGLYNSASAHRRAVVKAVNPEQTHKDTVRTHSKKA